MFWDKGYTPSQNIEALLEKENATVEEFLDDEDILQECKSLKRSIVNYFTRPDVIKRLIEFITTEPSEELPMAQRYRHANMACEILTFGLPSLDEKLLSDSETLKTLYSYLENEPPLNPLLSSFFSKTFSMLFTKKAEQDWFLYQQMCLQFLEYIKTQNNFLDLICKHFTTPVIPDLIMQMMRDVEGGQLKRNLYEWLTDDKLVERLIGILCNPLESDKHANVAEFLCDLIQQGRSMRQTEQENDSFEPAFDGSNPILKTIESEATIEALLNVILEPNAQESAIVSGITVVLTLIKPVVFVDEPNSDRLKFIHNREKEIHEQILTTVIRVVAPRLKDFHELLRNPPKKPEVVTTAAKLMQPFGMTRLQICRMFTVLLQTRNEDVSKAICETDFFETLLALFKQYCWNNFLHSEVEKCLQLIFYTQLSNNNNSTQGSTIVNDGSFNKGSNNGDNNGSSFFDFVFKSSGGGAGIGIGGTGEGNDNAADGGGGDEAGASLTESPDEDHEAGSAHKQPAVEAKETNDNTEVNEEESSSVDVQTSLDSTKEPVSMGGEEIRPKDDAMLEGGCESNDNDNTKEAVDTAPSALQTHVIVNCKLITKLIDCWQHNKDLESCEKGRRLGYMGHLIKIFKHITNCISESEHIGALIESNLSDLELWQSIVNPNDGDFTKALAMQSKMLANCNAHEAGDYSQHLPKDFLTDNSTWEYIMSPNMLNNLGALSDASENNIVFALDHEMYRNDLLDNDDNAENDLNLFQFGRNLDDDDEDDDENIAVGTGRSLFGKSAASTSALQVFGVTSNPWDNLDPFSDMTTVNSNAATPWAADFGSDNFADFDSHFSSFTNDLGESLCAAAAVKADPSNEEYDNNANVEKSLSSLGGFTRKHLHDDYEDDDNAKNEKVVSSLIRTLHSVMQDSEDDYEDDEGMWTKPLGGSVQEESISVIANGPTSKLALELESNEELNNSVDSNITPANITITSSQPLSSDATANNTADDALATKKANVTSKDQEIDANTHNHTSSNTLEALPAKDAITTTPTTNAVESTTS